MIFFGSHTFVPISWMCEKQASVSHSSTESEIIFGRWIEIRRASCSICGSSVLGNDSDWRDRGDPLSLTEVKDLKGSPTR